MPATPKDGPTASPDGYAPLGSVDLPGAKEAVVGDDGTTVFVAVTDGFAVVDVSDPAAPEVVHETREVLADVEDGPLEDIFDVKVDDDLLAVTGPANPAGEGALQAVAIFDVSDPVAPERVAYRETGFFNHNCFVRDGVVYLCGNIFPAIQLVMVDAKSGDELGRWSITDVEEDWAQVFPKIRVLHDVWVGDGVAYLAHWDAGTWMVDVSDPAGPELIAKVRGRPPEAFSDLSEEEVRREATEPPGNDHYVQAGEDGSLAVIGVESWDITPDEETGGPGGLYLYNVANPKDASELATIEPPPTPDPGLDGVWTTSHNFDLADGLLYTSWYRGGVRVYDVSNPTAPEELIRWRNAATTDFWTAKSATEEFFIASSRRDPSVDPPNDQPEAAAIYTFPAPDIETPTPSPTRSLTSNSSQGGLPGGGTTGDGPGFGALAALCGLGLGVWRSLWE